MKRLYLVLPFFALFVGCDGNLSPIGPDEIVFSVGYPQTKATSSSFEVGDMLSLWAVEQNGNETIPLQVGGNYINNEHLTFNGEKWVGTRTLYWSNSSCDFYAVYPHQEVTSIEAQPFSIVADQNSAETDTALGGYEASDLLFASAKEVSRSVGTVHLQFKHIMSKTVVKIVKGEKFEGEIPDDIQVHIYNTVTSGRLNLQTGSIVKNDFGNRQTITARKVSNLEFEAVLIPQNIERSTPLFEVTMGGISYLLETSMSFRPGYVHTINITLNTSPDQEKIEISIDPSAQGWN